MVFGRYLIVVVVCKRKEKKPHPAWVFLRKMPEKQSILFAWPNLRNINFSPVLCKLALQVVIISLLQFIGEKTATIIAIDVRPLYLRLVSTYFLFVLSFMIPSEQ